MAHFAKLDENNNVVNVVSVSNDILIVNGVESEQAGIDFLTELYGYSLWKQTSYNKNFRKNYAGVGHKYDPDFDAFIPPQLYPSWKLDYTTYQWVPPVAMPENTEEYTWKWSEINKEWIKVAVPLV
jgi:hypothetical protein